MNKTKRLTLIASLVKKNQAKKRRNANLELAERDTGIALAPTLDDVDDELGRMSGFREETRDRNNVAEDELLFGVSNLGDDDVAEKGGDQ
jgi:hypothetical protein